MAIEKFKNEIGTDLNAYKIVKEDGTSENVKLLRNANITRVGTPLNEDTLNPIVDELNANTNDLTSLKASVKDLTTQQQTNTNDISNIKEKNAQQDTQIKEANDNITVLQQDTNTLKTQMPSKADLVDGKLPVSQLPSTGVVADKANSLVYGTGQEVTGNDVIGNIYNLGAYDTIVKNSDGSYTITRQTGYLNTYDVLDGLEPIAENNVAYRSKVLLSAIEGLPEGFNKYTINDSKNYNKNNPYADTSPDYAVAIVEDLFLIRGTTTNIDDIKEYLCKHSLFVQYKLATSYTEILEEKHYAQINQYFDTILDIAKGSENLFNHFSNNINQGISLVYNGTQFSISGTNAISESLGLTIQKTLEPGIYTISTQRTGGTSSANFRLIIHPGDWSWQNTVYFNADSNSTFVIKETTVISFEPYAPIEGNTINYIGYIMLNKGTRPLPYQPYKGGSVAYVGEVLTKAGENDVDDNFILQSKLNGASIEFAENDIILTTKSNQTSVNEILNRLDDMGFKWGSVHVYGNTDSTNSPTIKLAKSGAIAILQVSGLTHGSLYSSTAPHLYLTITDEDFLPASYDETFKFTYNERVGQVTSQTWSTGSVTVNYIEDAGQTFFENITFDLIQVTTTQGNRYKTNISFTYVWFVRTPPAINTTMVVNEEE